MKPSEITALEPSLPREAYWDAEFYGREQNAIFWSEWFYAGRAAGLESVGSYRVLDIAGESVIVMRTDEGLRAHLNFCRHRGSRLLCGDGQVRGAIRCPYHGWAYALDGRLLATPFVPDEAVPEESRRLNPAGVDEWGGFLFVNCAGSNKATLASQLGPIPERLARYPLAELEVARSLRYEVAANWKVLLEN
ncbi:MAG TPA: aromatic ring-hydroxylating dioxygenase subunit alpha, partial [Candidatus Nitrosotalea sp.]|nr:aromatic ring-hydroxylating dioxygenase subunit alpha [Candidatus Nitrosotalea sp.]